MTGQRLLATASILTLSLGLAACGGSNSGLSSTPPPAATIPPPPPPPPPPPSPPPAPAGSIGLVHEGDFATVGIGLRFAEGSQVGEVVAGPVAPGSDETVRFSYDPVASAYVIHLPGYQPGRLQTLGYSGSFDDLRGQWREVIGSSNAVTSGSSTTRQDVFVSLQWPANNTRLDLRYTSLGEWASAGAGQPERTTAAVGDFAYGIPTAPSEVPRTGTAVYDAVVRGRSNSDYPYWDVGGTARLQFDFGAGTLSGSMAPLLYIWDPYSLGTYNFTQTVYSTGSTRFSGRFDVPGSTANSFFEGQFTGPGAAELMARFQAPFLHPTTQTWSNMTGVWVGRRE